MKSTILSVLPFVGAALAQADCSRQTLTKTEKIYVTVQPSSEPTTTLTSTISLTTTITVRASAQPSVTSLKWSSYANGTSHDSTRVPNQGTAVSSSLYTPIAISESVAPSATPAETFSLLSSSLAISASETQDTPASTYAASPAETPAVNGFKVVSKAVSKAAIGTSKTGRATFYGGNLSGGTCSFTGYTIPSGIYGTALSDSNWANAGNCGACVAVTGPSGKKITAMVVDKCPGCGPNALDLFEPAFAALAAKSKGEIQVKWEVVPCGISSPIVLKNKEGTSPYWFSMQVMNANVPVAKLEVSTDGGKTWKGTERKDYNFFENSSGFRTETVDVKVTSVGGKTVITKGVSIKAMTTKNGAGNFAS